MSKNLISCLKIYNREFFIDFKAMCEESPFNEIIRNTKSHIHSLITGPPGSGKSKLLLDVYNYMINENVPVAKLAPTNSAAKRIAGRTIHSFFKINPNDEIIKFTSFTGIVIIDEISMVPRNLFDSIFSQLQHKTVFILFGDFCQLPPVSNNSIFSIDDLQNTFKQNMKYERDDILSCIDIYSRIKNFIFTSQFFSELSIIKLTHIYRTKNADLLDLYITARNGKLLYENSTIIVKLEEKTLQYQIKDISLLINDIESMLLHNYHLVVDHLSDSMKDSKCIVDHLSDNVKEGNHLSDNVKVDNIILPKIDRFNDITILSSTYSCIDMLYKAFNLNYIKISKTEVIDNEKATYYDHLYCYISQKVKLLEKSGDIQKYSIGIIIGYNEESDSLLVAFPVEDYDKLTSKYTIRKINRITIKKNFINYPIQPLDIMTIHKAQGQEFSTVVVIVDNLFDLGHFYTAITRAKESLLLAYHSQNNIEERGFNRTIYNTNAINIDISRIL